MDGQVQPSIVAPASSDEEAFRSAVAGALASELSATRAKELRIFEALMTPKALPPGADSSVIWLLETTPGVVLKIGRAEVVNLEIAFLQQTQEAGVNVFPKMEAHGALGSDAWYLMEAGVPDSGDAAIFTTEEKDALHPDWKTRLHQLLQPVAELYCATVMAGSCNVADYHYHQRIPNLFTRQDFRDTAAGFGVPMPVEQLLDTPIRLNGTDLSPLIELLKTVAARMPSPSLASVTMIHGDLHLKNMVRQQAGENFLFLDPRLQWDGMPIDRFGYGDPVYDLATMLHSVGGMTTILTAIASGTAERFVTQHVEEGQIVIDLAPHFAQLIDDTAREFPNLGKVVLPEETRGESYHLRLFTGAANATLGWLKYADAVKSPAAWWLMFALGLTYLSIAADGTDAHA